MKPDTPLSKQVDWKKPVSITMSDELKEKVRQAADKDGRSFSDFVCRLLDKHVK